MPDKLHIIFDLDGVAVAIIPQNFHIMRARNNQQDPLLYFVRKTACLYPTLGISLPHCVLPGFIELLKLLYMSELAQCVEISFFSAGTAGRNKPLITAILTQALGTEVAKRILPHVKICSWEHCTAPTATELQLQNKLYGIDVYKEDHKKDILQIVDFPTAKNTILVDDHVTVTCFNQERNYCATPSVSLTAFYQAQSGEQRCESAKDLLFQELNSIYYLTGVLIEHIHHFQLEQRKKSNEERVPITEKLFNFHFERIGYKSSYTTPARYVPQFNKNFSNQAYYDLGLSKLKELNPALCFVNSKEIRAHIHEPPTHAEQVILGMQSTVISRPMPGCYRFMIKKQWSASPRPNSRYEYSNKHVGELNLFKAYGKDEKPNGSPASVSEQQGTALDHKKFKR